MLLLFSFFDTSRGNCIVGYNGFDSSGNDSGVGNDGDDGVNGNDVAPTNCDASILFSPSKKVRQTTASPFNIL